MQSANSSWKARLECPQCGGDVEHTAGDPVFTCPFCKTNLFISSSSPLRYSLEARRADEKDFVFLPFWRFSGLKYMVLKSREIMNGLLDATVSSLPLSNPDISLGIAPQVLPLKMLTKADNMPEPETSAKESCLMAQKRANSYLDKPFLFERLIAESEWLIYAPFKIKKNTLILATCTDYKWEIADDDIEKITNLTAPTRTRKNRYSLNFIPLICPECGNDLPPHKGAVAIHCPNCSNLWLLKGKTQLSSISYQTMETGRENRKTVFLPFWHLHLSLSGIPIRNRAELISSAASYWHAPDSWNEEPVQIFVPAIKLNPRLYMDLSKRMSVSRDIPGDYGYELRPRAVSEPVKIPLEEAAQAIKVILSNILIGNSKLYPLVRETKIKTLKAMLTYVPFQPSGREYINQFTGRVIPSNALSLGRKL